MKEVSIFFLMILLFVVNTVADVTVQSKVKVLYPKYGTFETTSIESYQNLLKREETDNSVEGKGLLGKLIACFFPKGKDAQIFNLEEKILYTVDLDKETFSKSPIVEYYEEHEYGVYSEEEADEPEEEYEEEEQYRIIRQEIKVIDTKEKLEINQFKTEKYQVIYIYETEEIKTKKIHTDSLFIEIYTTLDTEIFRNSEKEKSTFNRAMLEAVGIDVDKEYYNEMIGMNWIKIFQSMDKESQKSEYSPDYEEFEKMKGHPVLVEGTFYAKDVVPPPEEKKKKKGFGGLGGFKKKLLKSAGDAVIGKDEESGVYKEKLAFRNETVSITFDKITEDTFKVPAGFKEIKK